MVGKIIRANSRNANRYAKTQRAKKIYGTKTPTDAEIRAKESKDRKQRIAEYKTRKKNPKAVIPKKTTGKKKPKYTKPDMINPDKEQESYTASQLAARRSNSRNTGRGSGARNTGGAISDPYGALARQPPMKKKDKSFNKIEALIKNMEYIFKKHESGTSIPEEYDVVGSNDGKFGKAHPFYLESPAQRAIRLEWMKTLPKQSEPEVAFDLGNKSFNKLKALIKNMESIIKNEESTQARVTDVDLGTKIRQRKREGEMRDEPKEVKTGDKYNFESRIGDAAIKSGCRLWKTELNNSFNNTLDIFQELYKDSYSDNKFNEQHGKGKKPRITESGRSGTGSLGGNTEGTDEEASHKMHY